MRREVRKTGRQKDQLVDKVPNKMLLREKKKKKKTRVCMCECVNVCELCELC